VTPEQEEQVRRALAAAARADDQASGRTAGPGGEAGMPPEVAARLDAVLADLVAPRLAAGSPDGSRSTDELAARRRRRRARLLVAAAAVCVIAGAGAAVVTDGFGTNGGSPDSTTAGSSQDDSTQPAPRGPGASTRAEGGPAEPRSMAGKVRTGPALSSATLREDVQRLVDRRPAVGVRGGLAGSPCTAPTLRPGERLLAVRLDGRLSSLVLGSPRGGTVEARVYSCAEPGSPVATTEVRSPAP
jgi:hypothetical protein